MIRFLKIIFIVVLLFFWGYGLYKMEKQNRSLQSSLNDLQTESENLASENKKLQDNIRYFSLPENLLKEARALFNYRQPGEKMLIIIPGNGQKQNE